MKKSAIILLAALALPFCLTAGGTQEGKGSSEEGAALVLWDQYYRGSENAIMETIVAAYEEQHPGVTVQREAKTLDDMKLVLQMAVQSGTGPDIMQLNQGEADMGAFVKSGLIADLSDQALSLGWEERLSKANLKAMGYKGGYYGVSVTGEVVGFFYNKEIFRELGLEIPTTLEALEALMAQVKEAGYTPINFGNLDGWTGIHEWSALQHVLSTRGELDAMMSGNPGNVWEVPANKEAAAKLVSWVREGYFTKDFSAIGYDDSATVFYQGESALMLTGNWLQGEIDANAPFEAGFFLMPAPADSPENRKAIGGPGIPFVINKETKNLDRAVAFLDLLTRQETAVLWAENGMLPALPIEESAVNDGSPLFLDIIRAYKEVGAADGMGYFIDWITPSFYDSSSASVQQLMAEEIDPDRFVRNLQADYDEFY